ncbi:MAG: lysophospholipid acyltransferase family protein [Hyphomicrobiales bacterium]
MTASVAVRSVVFNVLFYVVLVSFMVIGCGFYVTPRAWSMWALKQWAKTSVWLLRVVCGTSFEVRGREHLLPGAFIAAGKHQSAFDTFALLPLFADPAMVMKRELMWIPLFGWFARKFRMIGVDRSAGSAALKDVVAQGRRAVAEGRQIVIFPEGTRKAPDAPPDYKPGASALYLALGVPCVPFALNSGLYWPRRQFRRLPGTIVVEFLPAIPAGLPRRKFEGALKEAIEPATQKLVAEGRAALTGR